MRTASFEQREWIDPWRDRRPMTNDYVLVSIYVCGGMECEIGWYYVDGAEWCTRSRGTVLAWMPLPDAYNPAEEVE